jgi:hypothetical protein
MSGKTGSPIKAFGDDKLFARAYFVWPLSASPREAASKESNNITGR